MSDRDYRSVQSIPLWVFSGWVAIRIQVTGRFRGFDHVKTGCAFGNSFGTLLARRVAG
jgi:hypothetical protein